MRILTKQLGALLFIVCLTAHAELKDHGTVYQWAASQVISSPLPSLTNVNHISGGTSSTTWALAIRTNNQMVVWGVGESGQLVGLDADTTNDVAHAAAGWYDGVLCKTDGSLRTWGTNYYGEPPTVTSAHRVAGGDYTACALLSNGVIRIWSTSASIDSLETAHDGTHSNSVDIAATWYSCLSLKSDGSLESFPINPGSDIGTNPPAISDGWKIAAGQHFALCLRSNGTVIAWGNNTYGQTNVPAECTNMVGVAGGRDHAMAWRADGTLVRWGGSVAWQTNTLPEYATNVIAASGWSAQYVISAEEEPITAYYVATDGNDSDAGTETEPFLTVQHAVDVATAGMTVFIGVGTYAENVRTDTNAGEDGSPITIDGQNVAAIGSLSFENAYITAQNLTISGGTNLWTSLVYFAQTGDNCVLSNTIIDGALDEGLTVLMRWNGADAQPFGDAGSDNLIISNTFKNARCTANVLLYGDHNIFYGNRMIDSDQGDWFQVFGRTNYFIGNTCSNLYESGEFSNHADFFQTYGDNSFGSRGHLIESNTVIKMVNVSQLGNLTDDGIADIQDITFRNNVFVGVGSKISIAVQNVKFHNNTFVDCQTNEVNGGTLLVFADVGAVGVAHGGQALNNVFWNCGIAGNTNFGWYSFDTTLTNVIADYNFVAKDGGLPIKQDPDEESVGDPGGWDKEFWYEPNGINGGDPQFTDAAAFDFSVPTNSILVAGTNLTDLFMTDINGTTRPATGAWTIGAIEASGEAPPSPTQTRRTRAGTLRFAF